MNSEPAEPAVPPRFVCTRCGNCCRGDGFVRISDADAARIAAHLGLPLSAFVARHCRPHPVGLVLRNRVDGSCCFLEDNLCRVHDVKPEQCVRWPFWRSVLADPDVLAHAQSYCPALRVFDAQSFRQAAATEEIYENRRTV